jgi:hypothetical protein
MADIFIIALIVCVLSAGIAPWVMLWRLRAIGERLEALENEVAVLAWNLDDGAGDDPDGGTPLEACEIIKLEARAA